MKTKFSRKEKRLIIFTTTLSLGFLVLNGIYQWNNRVPDVVIPETPMPKDNALHYYERAAKLYVAPPAAGPALDAHLDTNRLGPAPETYSKEYDKLYPLARKRAFLKRNSKAIVLWREGLKRRYVQRPERDGTDAVKSGIFRMLARDLIMIEAHAKAQAGNWDGAADSLYDIIHFGHETARGGPLRMALSGLAIRDIGLPQIPQILPHLSISKKRNLARKLESLQQSGVTVADSLEEEKRAMQRLILKMTREREFRPLFVEAGGTPFGSPNPTEEEKQEMLNNVDWPLQVYSAWMNKANIFYEYSRCLDWQIEQVKKPYPLQSKEWPFPDDSHAFKFQLVWFKYQKFGRTPMRYLIVETKEALLTTMLAVDVYHAEYGKYPQSLNELVPKYLSKVPLDPYSNNQPLHYKPTTTRYLSSLRYPSHNSLGLPDVAPDGTLISSKYIRSYKTVPYTLYSIGLDSRDDGGKPYQDEKYDNDFSEAADRKRYSLRNYYDATKCDVVAGINW